MKKNPQHGQPSPDEINREKKTPAKTTHTKVDVQKRRDATRPK